MSATYPIPFPVLEPGPAAARAQEACPRPGRPAAPGVEDPSRPIGEFVAVWNGSVFGVKHLGGRRNARSFHVGEDPACDLWMPLEQLGGRDRVRLIRVEGERVVATILPGATGGVRRPDGSAAGLAELIRDRQAVESAELDGAHELALEPGERLHQDYGEFTFLANVVPRPKLTLTRRMEWTAPLFALASIALHVAVLGVAWRMQSTQEGINVDVAAGENPYLQMMALAPPLPFATDEISLEQAREQRPEEQQDRALEERETRDVEDHNGGGTGAKAAGDEGRAGDRTAADRDAMMGVKGPRDNPNPHMAQTKMIDAVMSSGVMSALAAIRSNAPTSPFSPYTTALGNDPVDARGHLMGSEYGPAYGVGGLGMFGTGAGGGGSNLYGFGLGVVGQMGHGYGDGDDVGIGRCSGTDCTLGHGRNPGRTDPDLRDRPGHGPEMRILDAHVYGGLSKDAIQRVISLNRNRVRHCYEAALRSSPDLAGRVTVSFTIAPEGNVRSAQLAGNSSGDDGLGTCILDIVRWLNFPAADGITAATYPFLFQMVGSDAP